MFLRKIDPLFEPFRALRAKFMGVKSVKGQLTGDAGRLKALGGRVGNQAKDLQGKVAGAKDQAAGYGQQAQGYGQQAAGYQQAAAGHYQQAQGNMQQMHGGPPPPGAPGAPGGPPPPGHPGGPGGPPGGINPNPPIRVFGFFKKRKVCTQCNTELDPTWEACPYCAQAAAQAAQAARPPAAPQKTVAFMLDGAGGGSMQLLGWIVPVQGPQKGQLFTLAPMTLVGTDPKCHVVLVDNFMSSRHAEIKAEGGVWILKDLGSTNGTYVNDRRIDKHELVDNDFVKFGSSLVKFKSL
jgi:hypothetical protein